MALSGVGPQAALTVSCLVVLILIGTGITVYKRRNWKIAKKLRDAEANNFPLNDVEAGRHRGVQRADTVDPALPTYRRNADQADQLPKILAEIERLEGLPPTAESQNLISDLKNEAALLTGTRTDGQTSDLPQIPPPTYGGPQNGHGPQRPVPSPSS